MIELKIYRIDDMDYTETPSQYVIAESHEEAIELFAKRHNLNPVPTEKRKEAPSLISFRLLNDQQPFYPYEIRYRIAEFGPVQKGVYC